MDNEEPKKPADVSARLDESELLKPGTAIKPGEKPPATQAQAQTANPSKDINKDVAEYNKFVESNQQAEQELEKPQKGALHTIWEIAKTILIAAAVVIFINTFVFQAYYVSGNSMNPDFHNSDYLLINKFQTSLRNITGLFGKKGDLPINRGDVLIFRPPEDMSIYYVKRAIALPGERVTLKDGVFTIYNKEHPEGFVLKEPYVDPQYIAEGQVDEVVSPGNVFVVGDNRSPGGSYDSRFWGQLPQNNIQGTAFFRLIPLNDIGFIPGINYNGSK
jgi:signal peptidase I